MTSGPREAGPFEPPLGPLGFGLRGTVRWYLENRAWVDAVQRKARYERERLGLEASKSRA